jgi:WD40 repeat protein
MDRLQRRSPSSADGLTPCLATYPIYVHLQDLRNNTIEYFSFEWFEDDSFVGDNKFRLAISWEHDAVADVYDLQNGNYESILTSAGTLDVCMKARLNVFVEFRSEIRWMRENCMG